MLNQMQYQPPCCRKDLPLWMNSNIILGSLICIQDIEIVNHVVLNKHSLSDIGITIVKL